MSGKNIRRHLRIPYFGPVRISWQDRNGVPGYARGKCLDVSAAGLRIETPGEIPVRTQVSLSADRINFAGSATVKHVERIGGKYILGLELSQALRERTLALAAEAQEETKPLTVA